MFHIGTTEAIVVLVIVLLVFGVGRIGKIAKELGSGIRAFRQELQTPDEENKKDENGNIEPK